MKKGIKLMSFNITLQESASISETLTNHGWGRMSNSTCACCEGLRLSTAARRRIKGIRGTCLFKEGGWYVHETPAASKEKQIIFTP